MHLYVLRERHTGTSRNASGAGDPSAHACHVCHVCHERRAPISWQPWAPPRTAPALPTRIIGATRPPGRPCEAWSAWIARATHRRLVRSMGAGDEFGAVRRRDGGAGRVPSVACVPAGRASGTSDRAAGAAGFGPSRGRGTERAPLSTVVRADHPTAAASSTSTASATGTARSRLPVKPLSACGISTGRDTGSGRASSDRIPPGPSPSEGFPGAGERRDLVPPGTDRGFI
jgi:hypothetical protein